MNSKKINGFKSLKTHWVSKVQSMTIAQRMRTRPEKELPQVLKVLGLKEMEYIFGSHKFCFL